MPKLKLSGRKLCTTGRKLAVCGCGSPCCNNFGNCRVVGTLTTAREKTWASVDYTSVLYSSLSGTFVSVTGTCAGSYEYVKADTTSETTTFPCRLDVGSFPQNTLYGTQNCSPPSGTTGTVRFRTTGVSGSWGGGTGGVQNSFATVTFEFTPSLAQAGGFSGGAQLLITFGFNNGSPTFTPICASFGWCGPITITPIMDAACIVGVRADFDVSRASGNGLSDRAKGYCVVAVCDKLIGCNGTGIACGSTPPGGASALLESLDQSLLS